MSSEGELYDYYFSEDLVSRFSQEFAMRKAIDELISRAKDKGPKQSESMAEEVLGRYLLKLSGQLVKSQKDSIDRTGQILYEVAEKTGVRFPSVPQRLIELGFMSTRPQDKLVILVSTPQMLTLKVLTCAAYSDLKTGLGEDAVRRLPCKYGCLASSRDLFRELNMDVEPDTRAAMSEEGYCEFQIRLRE